MLNRWQHHSIPAHTIIFEVLCHEDRTISIMNTQPFSFFKSAKILFLLTVFPEAELSKLSILCTFPGSISYCLHTGPQTLVLCTTGNFLIIQNSPENKMTSLAYSGNLIRLRFCVISAAINLQISILLRRFWRVSWKRTQIKLRNNQTFFRQFKGNMGWGSRARRPSHIQQEGLQRGILNEFSLHVLANPLPYQRNSLNTPSSLSQTLLFQVGWEGTLKAGLAHSLPQCPYTLPTPTWWLKAQLGI